MLNFREMLEQTEVQVCTCRWHCGFDSVEFRPNFQFSKPSVGWSWKWYKINFFLWQQQALTCFTSTAGVGCPESLCRWTFSAHNWSVRWDFPTHCLPNCKAYVCSHLRACHCQPPKAEVWHCENCFRSGWHACQTGESPHHPYYCGAAGFL